MSDFQYLRLLFDLLDILQSVPADEQHLPDCRSCSRFIVPCSEPYKLFLKLLLHGLVTEKEINAELDKMLAANPEMQADDDLMRGIRLIRNLALALGVKTRVVVKKVRVTDLPAIWERKVSD